MPGILNARAPQQRFRFHTVAPATGLAPVVAHYWIVTWDLRGEDPYEQQVLPYPAVNMIFKPDRCRVAGVPRGRFSETLHGAGRVFGVRFQPGGFRPFRGAPISSITDRFLPVEAVFGAAGAALAEAVVAAGVDAAVQIMDGFLAERAPGPDPARDLAAAVVARIAADPGLTRVDRLAAESGLATRRPQRLFAEYVGVGPKWVIRRYRLHEAAARAAEGTGLDPVELALSLGYADQAHFTRDFTAIVGVPPARYANAQRSDRTAAAGR